MGCDWIGTEHVLLALIRQERCVANVVLKGHGFAIESLRETARRVLQFDRPPGEPPDPEHFTDRACKVLAAAEEERKRLNHPFLGTEHILLALALVRPSVAGAIFGHAGLSHSTIEADIRRTLGSASADLQ